MDFKLSKKLNFQLTNVIHIGAHKFEELADYQSNSTQRVLWVDPVDIYLPDKLPEGHFFVKYFVTMDDASHTLFNTYEATGFSSSKFILNPGNILIGTPETFSQSSVPNISGVALQNMIGSHLTISLCIDVQGSEWEVLRSFELNNISEVIVETSRRPLYGNSKPHKDVVMLLKSAGFIHNFNGSDFFIGHGDQYFSRIGKRFQFAQWIYRCRQSISFVLSIASRLDMAVKMRLEYLKR